MFLHQTLTILLPKRFDKDVFSPLLYLSFLLWLQTKQNLLRKHVFSTPKHQIMQATNLSQMMGNLVWSGQATQRKHFFKKHSLGACQVCCTVWLLICESSYSLHIVFILDGSRKMQKCAENYFPFRFEQLLPKYRRQRYAMVFYKWHRKGILWCHL